VSEGDLRIDFRDGAVRVATGEMFVVPRGVEHKPYAENEVKEPHGVFNTGHAGGYRTASAALRRHSLARRMYDRDGNRCDTDAGC
jgi:hypothetical protein